MSRLLPSLLALCLLLACSQEKVPATAIAVSIKADPALRAELTSIAYRVLPRDADPAKDQSSPEVRVSVAEMSRPFVITRGTQREILVAVRGFGTGGNEALVDHQVRARFEDGKTLALPIYLSSACLRKGCTEVPGQTCYGQPRGTFQEGDCAPIAGPDVLVQVMTPGQEDDWLPTASVRDAGMDDGGADGGGECVRTRDAGLCDPVAQCGCLPGQACQNTFGNSGAAPLCVTPGKVEEGGACTGQQDCAASLECRAGVCRKYCNTDADCGGDRCYAPRPDRAGVCWRPCGQPGNAACAVGTTCSPLSFTLDDQMLRGTFCAVPQNPCSYTDDGGCDEPIKGSGLCAAGTDTKDCCAAGNGQCDVVSQCGCDPKQTCAISKVTGRTIATGCYTSGTKPPGSACESTSECQVGAACLGLDTARTCSVYCELPEDCSTNQVCIAFVDEQNKELDVGRCFQACNFASPSCPTGTVCAGDSSSAVCFRQPTRCHLIGNGRCDETTRFCAPGTDTDCPR